MTREFFHSFRLYGLFFVFVLSPCLFVYCMITYGRAASRSWWPATHGEGGRGDVLGFRVAQRWPKEEKRTAQSPHFHLVLLFLRPVRIIQFPAGSVFVVRAN